MLVTVSLVLVAAESEGDMLEDDSVDDQCRRNTLRRALLLTKRTLLTARRASSRMVTSVSCSFCTSYSRFRIRSSAPRSPLVR